MPIFRVAGSSLFLLVTGITNLLVVGIFVANWLLSAVIYRWKSYDERPAA